MKGRQFVRVRRRCFAGRSVHKRHVHSGPGARELSEVVALTKRRGFVFPGSRIYGGFANQYDFGPLGVQLKKNIQDLWWKSFVVQQPDCHGLETSVLMNPKIWQASGHVDNFVDPLVECKQCDSRFRADNVLKFRGVAVEEGASLEDIALALEQVKDTTCPCGKLAQCEWSEPRQFNLLFETRLGPVEARYADSKVYLRPETAQGAYVNFQHVYSTMRQRLPFGVGQTGRSFRNEISPGNFIFRTREFDQMELQWFCENQTSTKWYEHWTDTCHKWLVEAIGLDGKKLRRRTHAKAELAHYARATTDLEYYFPSIGWGELWGIADRGTYDLKRHSESSGEDMRYTNPGNAKAPKQEVAIVEPAVGLNRLLLAALCDAFTVEALDGENTRVVLKLHRNIAPVDVAIMPLSAKNEAQSKTCHDLYKAVSNWGVAELDSSGSIGKRYRRQDEIGTPYCITVDFDSSEDGRVTVRDRDSMEQVRVHIDDCMSRESFYKCLDV